jgi:hypothetical protein
LLKGEMRKILRDPERQEGVKKFAAFVAKFVQHDKRHRR